MIEQLFEFVQNHWMLSSAAVAILALIIFEELKGKISGAIKLSAQNASIMLNRENVVVIDLRKTQLFTNGHILGSINITSDEIDKHLKKIATHKNDPVILVSDNNTSISTMVTKLRAQGFTKIYMLAGGINAWKEAQLPLSK